MEDLEHVVSSPLRRTHDTPILLLHGAWHGAWCWDNWRRHFSSLGYEVHAFSLPGHGGSSCNKGNLNRYTLEDYVDALANAVSGVSPTPVVVGHSMGGGVLQKYLESHVLPGAVLLATVPASGSLGMLWRMLRRHPVVVLKSMLTCNMYHWVATEALARDLFLGPAAKADDVSEFQRRLGGETIATMRFIRPYAGLNARPTPVLVLAAERDAIFTVAEHRATAEKYGARLVVFEGQAHDLMLEPAWANVADTIDGWITHELRLQ